MIDYRLLKSTLDQRVKENTQVFITPHLGADFDAIASAIGLSIIINKLGKPCYILMNDDAVKVEPGVKLIMEEFKDKVQFITMDKFIQLKSDKDLLIATDVNKSYLVGVKEFLSEFNDIVIIDHHEPDERTIETKEENKFISTDESSASEIVSELLIMFNLKAEPLVANYLLAGIYLDTDHLRKNTTSKTMKLVAKLMERGADINRVNEYFEEDFISDRKVQALINKANFFTYTVILAIEDGDVEYTKEELAKVADYLLKFKADATIAAGHIDKDLISISARSKGKIDVGEIMSTMGGGGNSCNAASKIEGESVEEVEKKLIKAITPNFYRLNNPQNGQKK